MPSWITRAGQRPLAVLLASVALVALARPAFASDGFFCVGPGYLAYEFDDGGHTPIGRAGLYIIRLTGSDGPSDPVVYEFKPGTVRGMRCLDAHVQLLDDQSIRSVDLDGPRAARAVRIAQEKLASAGSRPDGFVVLNLGELSHVRGATWPEDVALPGTSRFTYALAIVKTAGVPENHLFSCNPAAVTRLDQFDANHILVRSLEIAAGCDRSEETPSPLR
jgi:hypothetical protein